jgi:hypothetical protein
MLVWWHFCAGGLQKRLPFIAPDAVVDTENWSLKQIIARTQVSGLVHVCCVCCAAHVSGDVVEGRKVDRGTALVCGWLPLLWGSVMQGSMVWYGMVW